MVKNQVRQTESVNHISQPAQQERFIQQETAYYEQRENNYQPHIPSAETSPVTAANFAANFHENFERECCIQDQDNLPETPSSSKEHFSPRGFAPPYMPRVQSRSERPTAIRMLPKGGKSRVRKQCFFIEILEK